jgi:hypothetical protein
MRGRSKSVPAIRWILGLMITLMLADSWMTRLEASCVTALAARSSDAAE